MKKKNKSLLWIGLAGLVIWAMQKIRAFKSIDLQAGFPTQFRFESGGIINFTLPLTAFNASGTAVNLGGLDLRVYVENIFIGRAYIPQRYRINPVGTTIIPANVRVSIWDLASAIPGFVAGSQDRNVTFRYSGVATVEGVWAPVDFTHNFNLPKI